jgi:hypothetical protein
VDLVLIRLIGLARIFSQFFGHTFVGLRVPKGSKLFDQKDVSSPAQMNAQKVGLR